MTARDAGTCADAVPLPILAAGGDRG